MKTSTYILIGIIAFMAAATVLALGFPLLRAKLTPLVLCPVILVLAAVQLVYELRGGKKQTSIEEAGLATDVVVSRRSYMVEFTWALGFVIGIFLLGFFVSIPLFDVLYLRSHGTNWRITILITVVMTAACWAVFSVLLQASLYPGVILSLLGW